MKTKIYSLLIILAIVYSTDSIFGAWYTNPTALSRAGATTNCPTDGALNADAMSPISPDPSPMLPWSTGTMYYSQARVITTWNPMTCQFWDATIPTVSMTNASPTWKNANITAVLTSGDLGWSGLNTARYFLNQNNAIPAGLIDANYCLTNGTPYISGGGYTIVAEGNHTLYLCAQDVAWNQSILWTGIYRLDKTDPTTSATNASLVWKNVNIPITLNTTDPISWAYPLATPSGTTGAGAIRRYVWRYDNGGAAPTLASCLAGGTTFNNGDNITLIREWNHTLYLCAQDVAWNQSILWTGIYRLDKTLPDGTITYLNGWTNLPNTQTIFISTIDPLPGVGVAVSDILKYTVQVSSSSDSPSFGVGTWSAFTNLPECTNLSPPNDCNLNPLSNHTAYMYQLVIDDIAGNQYIRTSSDILKVDTTIPTLADVTNANPPNYLAGTSLYVISVNNALGSPITSIETSAENQNTILPPTVYTSATWLLSFPWNMSNVDSDRLWSGGREYTFNLTRIRDEAGNEWNAGNSRTHTVYANTMSILQDAVTSESLSNLSNIADGTTKNLTLRLEDTYGNAIIPASGIGRMIDLNFDVDNTMSMNQFDRSWWDSVFVNRTTVPWVFSPRLTIDTTNQFDSEVSLDGNYSYGFQVYTPTFNQDSIYWPVSDPTAHFNIDGITYDINSSTTILPGDTPQSQWVTGLPIVSVFSPLFHTAISWNLRDGGFIEGTEQISSVRITKNSAASTLPATDTIKITFSGANANRFNYFVKQTSPPDYQITGFDDYYISTFGVSTNLPLISRLEQWPIPVSNLSTLYMATHMSYILNGKPVVTNSDIIGKPSFYQVPISSVWNQVGIKILWSVASSNINAIVTDQFSTGVSIFTNMNRSLIREQIRKSTSLATRNTTLLPISSTLGDVTTLPGVWATTLGVIIRQSSDRSIMLIEQAWWTIDLTASMISGVRTLVIRGASLYIKNDMYYDPSKPSMLGVVIQKDANNNGWNLYIDPLVTNVVGAYIVDGSLMSYDSIKWVLGANASIADLKNQLHIFGTIVSENTIGWSRQIPTKCPNLLNAPCANIADAQKYDLNYLRRYYITNGQPFGGARVIGGETCIAGICTTGNTTLIHKFSSISDEFAKYPTIIEFNPAIQALTPIGFDLVFE